MHGHYRTLGLELIIHFAIMYLVMYAMIAAPGHFHLNLNNVYMTLMMVAPMAVLMLALMRPMYANRRLNLIIGGAAVVVFAGAFWGMRAQAAIGDREFLRSMIPHHSGAILMCRQASIRDPEIVALCGEIVDSQQREIDQMQAMLDRL